MGLQRLIISQEPSGVSRLTAAGPWIAVHAGEIDRAIGTLDESAMARMLGAKATLDCSNIDQLDTFGATLITQLVGRWRAAGHRLEVVGLADRFGALVGSVAASASAPEGPEPPPSIVASFERWFTTIGAAAQNAGRDFIGLVNILGAMCQSLATTAGRPATFRLTSTVHHLDRVGWQAVPIVLLITILIGGIIAQQGFFHFAKFGADAYVVDMVGILVLREIGVLIVAIMVAGRSGSSYTAELGSMKMREEIDALRTMGLDPVALLVVPRILALIIALPILTFLGSMSALLGGGIVAWAYGDMAPEIFIARLKEAISITHFQVGMIKAPFMALVIGLVACSEGLKVRGSAESLGRQTTASVVQAIFLVIVLDGLFAIFFASIGM